MLNNLQLSTLFVLFLAVSTTEHLNNLSISSKLPSKELFKTFHFVHKKDYKLNSEEALNRYRIFKANLKWIKEENKKLGEETFGITEFADMTHEEFNDKMNLKPEVFEKSMNEMTKESEEFLGNKDPSWTLESDLKDKNAKFSTEIKNDEEGCPNCPNCPKPDNGVVDYRGMLGDAKSQGQCGSCWAFAAIGAMESLWSQSTKTFKTFSEQFLVNCDSYDNGCYGGFPRNTLIWIRRNGLLEADKLPYKAKKERCDPSLRNGTFRFLRGWYEYRGCPCCYGRWKKYQQQRPIIVAMDAKSDGGWMHYKPKTFTPYAPKNCRRLNHAVLAVGNTIENGVEYVIVRNSWGKNWGFEGHFKIKAKDSCGITMYAWMPVAGSCPSCRTE